jgi:hypothetical protein
MRREDVLQVKTCDLLLLFIALTTSCRPPYFLRASFHARSLFVARTLGSRHCCSCICTLTSLALDMLIDFPVNESIQQINNNSWIIGSRLLLSRQSLPPPRFTWSDGKGSWYVISEAPCPLPQSRPLSAQLTFGGAMCTRQPPLPIHDQPSYIGRDNCDPNPSSILSLRERRMAIYVGSQYFYD